MQERVVQSAALAREGDAALLAWLQAHGGSLTIGDTRYYVGSDSTNKCRDNEATAGAMLAACNGDLALFAQALSANAFKVSVCKTALGEDGFKAHFDKIIKQDVKTGKPVRKVLTTDQRFLKNTQDEVAD